MSTPAFAERVQEIRRRLGLTQEDLAARLGVSFATVNRWEAGRARPQRAQAAAFEKLWEEAGGLDDEAAGGEAAARTGRRRRGVQRNAMLGNKGMEQMLWDAACSIRGEQDAPKFKDYILPLLFIK